MLDNSRVYVTCTCILTSIRTLNRYRRARVKRTGKEFGSLGDFPVGTPVGQLVDAFENHLEDVSLVEDGRTTMG